MRAGTVLVLFFLLLSTFFPSPSLAATTVTDVFRLTFSDQLEDWPVIYKDAICWADPRGGVYCNDMNSHSEFPLLKEEQPLSDLFGLVGIDNRFIVYNRFTEENSFDVAVYDLKKKEEIRVTDEIGFQWAHDYDDQTLIYTSGGICGNLYSYDIRSEEKTLISEFSCGPAKISQENIVWTDGTIVYGYDLRIKKLFEIAYGAQPDIFNQYVVWVQSDGKTNAVYLKNLFTGIEKILHSSDQYDFTWPTISEKYAIWGKSTTQYIAGVEGIDLKTGEIFTLQSQGSHQNSVINPQIAGNIASWMAGRTGNGDIYGAIIRND